MAQRKLVMQMNHYRVLQLIETPQNNLTGGNGNLYTFPWGLIKDTSTPQRQWLTQLLRFISEYGDLRVIEIIIKVILSFYCNKEIVLTSILVKSSYSHTRGNPGTPEKTNEYKVDHWLKWQSRIMFLIMLMIAHPNPYSILLQIHMSTDWGETEGSGVVVGFLFTIYQEMEESLLWIVIALFICRHWNQSQQLTALQLMA